MRTYAYKLVYSRVQPTGSYCFYCGNGFKPPGCSKAVPYHRLETYRRVNKKKSLFVYINEKRNITDCTIWNENYLGCIDFDLWSVLKHLFYGIHLSQVTCNCGSRVCIYVVNLKITQSLGSEVEELRRPFHLFQQIANHIMAGPSMITIDKYQFLHLVMQL